LGYNYVYIENGVIFTKKVSNNKNVTVRGMTSSIARSKRNEDNVTALSNLSSREHLSSRYG